VLADAREHDRHGCRDAVVGGISSTKIDLIESSLSKKRHAEAPSPEKPCAEAEGHEVTKNGTVETEGSAARNGASEQRRFPE
jgi:hypothetical protein